MSDNFLEPLSKRRRVAANASSAGDVTLTTTNDESNESHHAPAATNDAQIEYILTEDGQIQEHHMFEALGSICNSLGRTIYMVHPEELGSMVYPAYTRKTAIEKSIEHCSTILLPILRRKKAEHWVLVVVSHNISRMYCALYREDRVNDAMEGTNAFIDKYLQQSQFSPGKTLHQCACCVSKSNADSGICVLAFGMYVIAQCSIPNQLPMDTWRLIMAYLLGFKDTSMAERNRLLSTRRLDDETFNAITASGFIDKTKLKKHRDDADKFITESVEILDVLRKVRARMTESSGSSSRARTIRDRLELTINHLSGLEQRWNPRRDQLSRMLSNFESGMAAATDDA
ncbi:hypothetical protein GQ607_011770 [Colletotrichum asianum]|uniref:Ubiquitin-like protease family profile domain-containing protein n=1 Tax=Colletotrichum asianum TaxID=702518 RepID=A0A8H3W845_9PEZI|nr:hypothetical protein GQ607_011770 [Colletotrichum asianum]